MTVYSSLCYFALGYIAPGLKPSLFPAQLVGRAGASRRPLVSDGYRCCCKLFVRRLCTSIDINESFNGCGGSFAPERLFFVRFCCFLYLRVLYCLAAVLHCLFFMLYQAIRTNDSEEHQIPTSKATG